MKIQKTLCAGVALAAVMLLGEAAARPAQLAEAAKWEWYIGNDDVYCEGCCTPGLLCCSSELPCRISPD